MTRNRRSTSRSVSDAVGSSMMTIFASAPIALAISTICCSGMLSVSTSRAGSIAAPIALEQLARRWRRAGVQSTRRQAPPRLERQRDVLGDGQVAERATAAGRWRRCRARASGAGSIAVTALAGDGERRRASGVSAPVMILISVDLPAPFSPTSACTSPARRSNDTPRSARTPANDLVMEPPRQQEHGADIMQRRRYNSGPRHGKARLPARMYRDEERLGLAVIPACGARSRAGMTR